MSSGVVDDLCLLKSVVYIILLLIKQTRHFASCVTNLSSVSSDLVLLACNWSTMGDSFFVCHHLAALYAYGYVLVSHLRAHSAQTGVVM